MKENRVRRGFNYVDTFVTWLYVIFVFFTSLSVIATMRDLKKKDKLVEAAGDAYGKTLTLLPLDVCSDESVKQCISSVKDRHIDILSKCDANFK